MHKVQSTQRRQVAHAVASSSGQRTPHGRPQQASERQHVVHKASVVALTTQVAKKTIPRIQVVSTQTSPTHLLRLPLRWWVLKRSRLHRHLENRPLQSPRRPRRVLRPHLDLDGHAAAGGARRAQHGNKTHPTSASVRGPHGLCAQCVQGQIKRESEG